MSGPATRPGDLRLTRRQLLSPRACAAAGRWLAALVRDLAAIALRLVGLVRPPPPPVHPAFPGSAPPVPASAPPLHRPPKARREESFLERCTRCGACMRACPYGAIVPGWDGGTPVIEPRDRGCELCPDFPCVAACPTGALHSALPPSMGVARITGHCLNHLGDPCRVCADQCPVAGALVVGAAGPPVVVAAVCTGCGICEQVCPAPTNAILLLPHRRRPEPDEAAAAGGPDPGAAG